MDKLVKTAKIRCITERREINGVTEYKVRWKYSRFFKWVQRSRFDSLHLAEAFDAEALRIEIATQNVIDHEAEKTKTVKIIGERSVGDSTKYLVLWGGRTWEKESAIPKEVMESWKEDKVLKTPSPTK